MNRLPVPSGLHDITPSWLTRALGSVATPEPASVTSFSAETIGAGTGFMASLFRLSLSCEHDHPNLPRTAILKLPSSDPALSGLSNRLRQNKREVRFYQERLAQDLLQVPHAYHSGIDPATGNTFLLLEDIADYPQGDSVLGCSLPQAHHCIAQLAKFQAAWWDHPHLDTLDWLPLKDAETRVYQDLWPSAWRSLCEKAGDHMPPGLRSLGEGLSSQLPRIKSQLSRRPLTIIHGDYRLDNCFFPDQAGPRSPIVFDWEFCARSRGACDIATFISESFPPHQRKAHETALLRTYHSTLVRHGVHGYSFEECLRDYRLSMLDVLALWVITAPYCDFSGPRATTYLHNTLHRLDAAISDLSPSSLIQS